MQFTEREMELLGYAVQFFLSNWDEDNADDLDSDNLEQD